MAETLFRQWFVEEAGEDWGEGVLDDILTVKGGTTPSTKNADFWNGDIHWTTQLKIENRMNFSLNWPNNDHSGIYSNTVKYYFFIIECHVTNSASSG
jgi:hypothetical protein